MDVPEGADEDREPLRADGVVVDGRNVVLRVVEHRVVVILVVLQVVDRAGEDTLEKWACEWCCVGVLSLEVEEVVVGGIGREEVQEVCWWAR